MNEASGAGHGPETVARIEKVLEDAFGGVHTIVVRDHPSAAARARDIAHEWKGPAVLFVGGGGGTLRGVIEGIAEAEEGGGLPGPDRLLLAPLRMGSGNLLAKKLGVPKDPVEACSRLVFAVRAGRIRHCPIGAYEFELEDGTTQTRYAASLAGFGQLGRVPGDLERWHRSFPGLRRAFARVFGLERWNDFEYAAATLRRAVGSALAPRSVEEVCVLSVDGEERMRLLAGVVLAFDVPALPFAGPGGEGGKLSAWFVPYRGRFQAITLVLAPRRHARSAIGCEIEPGRPLSVTVTDRDRVEMFLDEDPVWLHRRLEVRIAGTLAFVSAA